MALTNTDFVQLPIDSSGKKTGMKAATIGGATIYLPASVLYDEAGNAIDSAASRLAGTERGIASRVILDRHNLAAADAIPVDATPTSPVATDYLPVRLTDGTIFNYNQSTYLLYQSPRVTTAAATDFFDLFNAAGSGKKIRVMGLYAMLQITAASAIIPSFQFSLIKTSAVGTGGTAHTFEGAASPTTGLVNIARSDGTDSTLPAQITSRSLPTGGATASKFLFDAWLVSEETNPAAYLTQMYNLMPVGDAIKEVILAEGEGVKVRQITATASTGTNYGWLLTFTLV